MTHAGLPSLLRVHDRSGQLDAPGAQKISFSFLAPSPRKAKCRPLLWKHGLCRFWDCCFYLANLTVNTTMARAWGGTRSRWMEAETTGWILSVNTGTHSLMGSGSCYFRLDTLFHVLESPCCLWCLGLADWLEASLFEEYDSRMSQSVNPWVGAPGML